MILSLCPLPHPPGVGYGGTHLKPNEVGFHKATTYPENLVCYPCCLAKQSIPSWKTQESVLLLTLVVDPRDLLLCWSVSTLTGFVSAFRELGMSHRESAAVLETWEPPMWEKDSTSENMSAQWTGRKQRARGAVQVGKLEKGHCPHTRNSCGRFLGTSIEFMKEATG